MKANVVVRFRDKHTKKVYNIGTEYEDDDDRINELVGLGFVEVAEEEVTEDQEYMSSILEENVQSIKDKLNEADEETLKSVLEEEKNGRDRKGVIDHIQSLLESE